MPSTSLRLRILPFLLLFLGQALFAQRTLIDVKIDSPSIRIGEQTLLHLTVTTDPDKTIQIIIPNDTLMAGVEILHVSQPDSTIIDNNRLSIKQTLLLTSFDSALYLLPPLIAIDNNDTAYSNQLALKVSAPPVDTDNPDQFFDIKNIWHPPFVWTDYYPLLLVLLLLALLAIAIPYIIRRIRRRQPLLPFAKETPLLPPHEQAIQELDCIKRQNLWQQGRTKEYYTAITDTLRKYIAARFNINAMELTSDEILLLLLRHEQAQSVHDNLKDTLHLADFVKFAKYSPLPNDNQNTLANAYLFVNQTANLSPSIPSPETSL